MSPRAAPKGPPASRRLRRGCSCGAGGREAGGAERAGGGAGAEEPAEGRRGRGPGGVV